MVAVEDGDDDLVHINQDRKKEIIKKSIVQMTSKLRKEQEKHSILKKHWPNNNTILKKRKKD